MQQHKIVILTGAGISAESGLGTFRDTDGLWTQYDLEEVATPQGFARNSVLVHDFYNARRANCANAAPNPAHHALTRLQRDHPGEVVIVTQNVDDLHEQAGSRDVLHMHGRLKGALCQACGHRWEALAVMNPDDPCPSCAKPATRPDVVWFGEIPYFMETILTHLSEATHFAAIGTSGEVYPAAGFAAEAAVRGAHTVEINLEPSGQARHFSQILRGKASETVPAWVDSLLNG